MNHQQLIEAMEAVPLADGRPASLFRLTNSAGTEMLFMDLGASWLSCRLPVQSSDSSGQRDKREVVLGVADMAGHQRHTAYFGATVGRFANRIAGGQFTVDGQHYQVATNGDNCLHGGPDGFNSRRWQAEQPDAQTVIFTLHSPDGDQGFPGNLEAEVSYQLTEDNSLLIRYRASVDKACPVNLTNHAYFNLQGADCGESVLAHKLTLLADHYLPADERMIPTGEVKPVAGTSFDFRSGKTLGQDLLADEDQQRAGGYDHTFLFRDNPSRDSEQPVARLSAPDNSVVMEVCTDKPGLQLYTGNFLAGNPARSGGEYQNNQGVALETQLSPDAPNQQWPHASSVLRPGEIYSYQTRYRFIF